LIITKDLHYNYPDGTPALEGISLKIKMGEAVAIMGPNGAGKTTLAKHFNGLLKPTQGDVLIARQNTKNCPVSDLAKTVGYVGQDPNTQLFEKTVSREIAFGLVNLNYPPHKIKKRVDNVLSKIRLSEFATRSPLSLSAGQKKRVTIASMVAMNPDFLILDEPTVAQDVTNKNQIKHMLTNQINDNKTIILITHDIEFALTIADRLIFMKDGQIISDTPKSHSDLQSSKLSKLRLNPPQMVEFSERVKQQIWADFPVNLYTINEIQEEVHKRWHVFH